ncbi:hypothetical protein CCHR01_19580 [Colletotrichum chrysophilum]|uniref:Uncharacterized protein n=1 Tax=Colletotrichum chrysophilum TaxID=1836956 RepID=A0AAD9EAA2_9PEZI|nr:hypothetical protein CCHR01_19580 [Colletotrichum chrysophilum]
MRQHGRVHSKIPQTLDRKHAGNLIFILREATAILPLGKKHDPPNAYTRVQAVNFCSMLCCPINTQKYSTSPSIARTSPPERRAVSACFETAEERIKRALKVDSYQKL